MFTLISKDIMKIEVLREGQCSCHLKGAFPAMFEVYWDHRNVSDKPCDLRPSISTQSIGVRRSIKVGRKDVLLSINSNNKKCY